MKVSAGRVVMIVALCIVVLALVGGLTMFLWNALVPVLFKGPTVTYIQAIGLLILSHILLRGGWSRRGCGGGHFRRRWQEKMDRLTPEEKERLRAHLAGLGPSGAPKAQGSAAGS